MSKISAEHLARGAYVYVRQSSADQLQHNHESRRRQYALAERARALGWSEVIAVQVSLKECGDAQQSCGFRMGYGRISRSSPPVLSNIRRRRSCSEAA